jgi:hypothetical protein
MIISLPIKIGCAIAVDIHSRLNLAHQLHPVSGCLLIGITITDKIRSTPAASLPIARSPEGRWKSSH